ncbi:hypothetical protein BUALT_Bualt09G0095200 [Buddleja alternifolia]|uniref:Small nuclear ribonucleoprotein G n=1 Tax=Buddleja alternifolia TaxID=168488 RepID=A0AAV6XC45_9LAMI|nr:hypothetical protein BUALT_Bualt09G0095200 [Buddleja alternifolia]
MLVHRLPPPLRLHRHPTTAFPASANHSIAFLSFVGGGAGDPSSAVAEELDYKIKNNEEVGPLAGIFVGVGGVHEISPFLEVVDVGSGRGFDLHGGRGGVVKGGGGNWFSALPEELSGQPPDLKKYMDKKLQIKLNANRMVVGTFRGFDQFMNLVIDNTVEVNGNEKTDIGMVVIRGNSVVTVEALEPVARPQ